MSALQLTAEKLLPVYIDLKRQAHAAGEEVRHYMALQDEALAERMAEDLRSSGEEIPPDAEGVMFVECPLGDTSMLPHFIRGMREAVFDGRPVIAIGLCTDAYYKTWPHDAEPEHLPERGELKAAFEAGDMTVGDALQVCVVTQWGRSSATVPYRVADNGDLLFDEPIIVTGGEVEGLVPDALELAVAP